MNNDKQKAIERVEELLHNDECYDISELARVIVDTVLKTKGVV